MSIPLSEKLRPHHLDELVGQQHLMGENSFLSQIIREKKPLSILFWGPPGCGKTTLARIYGQTLSKNLHQLSAVSTSTAEIKEILQKLEKQPLFNPYAVIFLDEIHRFNKSQQDLFLPYLENGKLILIGATTENPSFSLNSALLSRMRVLTLKALSEIDLREILIRFEKIHQKLPLGEKAKDFLIQTSNGDGRYLLNMVENILLTHPQEDLSVEQLKKLLQRRAPLFDKQGDAHYNLISALHKAVRGSDPDAALYWLTRLLNGGENPLYIGRRLIRMASEDIGLADPKALQICLEAFQAYQILGSPEGDLSFAQAAIYLSLAPKSNASYLAFKKASQQALETSHLPPPLHILNAPTKLMKNLGYSKGYQYDHDCNDQFSGQNYLPEEMTERPSYYHPSEIGQEREMKKRIEYFQKLRLYKCKKTDN